MSLSDVSNILWRERRLLELLVFKLEEEQLVAAAGRVRWFSHATREVGSVTAEIRRVELDRAVAVAALGEGTGQPGAPTLRELAGVAPTPWDGILAEHRRALLSLADAVTGRTVGDDPAGPDGRLPDGPTEHAGVAAAARAIPPSLVDFLR